MDTSAYPNLLQIYIWNVQSHDKARNIYALSLICLYDNALASILIAYITLGTVLLLTVALQAEI